MSVTLVPQDHFEALSNITRGQGNKVTERVLRTILNEIIALLNATETTVESIRQQSGAVASVLLTQGGQPTTTDTLDVGADTYQFLAAPAGVTSDIEVEIGANAEGTLDNLIAAAALYGTEYLKWTKVSATVISIKSADAADGTVAGADPSIVLDASGATNYSFDVGDVNMNTLSGKAASQQESGETQLVISAAMIASGAVRIDFPFTPTNFVFVAMTAAGAAKATGADTLVINGNGIVLTLNGGGGDLAATNILRIVAYA